MHSDDGRAVMTGALEQPRPSGWLQPRPRWAAGGDVPTIAVRRDVDLPVTPAVGWSSAAPAPRQRTAVAALVQKGWLAGKDSRPRASKPLTFLTSPRVTTPRGAQPATCGVVGDLAIAPAKSDLATRPRPASAGTLRLGRPTPVAPGKVQWPGLDTRNDVALRRQPKWSEAARRQWEESQKAAEADIVLAKAKRR